jgi:hypothetical protein
MTGTELHDELERKALELLPWYVNGTLEGEERELVARQVLASLTCRKELERLRGLQQLIQRDDPEAAAADRAFERLMARINAGDTPSDPRARQPGRERAWMQFAVAASLAAAVSALWWQAEAPPEGPRVYETLSSPQSSAALLRVVFAPGVGEPARLELLARHGLTRVEPATDDGVVTLAFADDADRAAIVAALKRDPRILLVTTPPGAEGR